ncbi:MAG: EVE domain-containing protein [Pyrinomonadaceae bacterium]
MMNFWLVKQEPEEFSWTDFIRDGVTAWTGVRNFQARNNLRAMRRGDEVLFYHSGKEKAVTGIAEIVKEAYEDPTTDDAQWLAVDLKPLRALRSPVTLQSIRGDDCLREIALIKQSRLSVMRLTREEYRAIVKLGG